MRPYLTHFGNPSSSHAYGRPSKAAVKYGRDRVANLMGCSSSEVFFVGSGSEAGMFSRLDSSCDWMSWFMVTAPLSLSLSLSAPAD